MDEANRMIEQGVEILKLNIGNPAPFGFKAPQELVDMMRGNLENAEGYSDSRGLLKSRQAIVEYCKKKNIPNVGVNDIYTGNGVSELITLSDHGHQSDSRTNTEYAVDIFKDICHRLCRNRCRTHS
jgi:alanine-synthesizing transaminase